MTRCLRSRVTDQSMVGSPAEMPNSLAVPTWWYTAAVSSSSLAGMQPTCKQVPPTLARSTMAMFSPAEAPYKAAA